MAESERTRTIDTVSGYTATLDRIQRTPGSGDPDLPSRVQSRIRQVFGSSLSASEVVDRILRDVRNDGDEAVRRYTEAFDGRAPASLEVPRSDWVAAAASLPAELTDALHTAAARIEAFHRKQPSHSWIDPEPLGVFGQLVRPLDRVGIYVPSGSAALPSSLLMAALPARVAGVGEVIVSAPPRHEGAIAPVILAAALVAGVDRMFAIGGAQAIGAMAYGTESVPRVDKVLGPGNIFVALAKKKVYGAVDIDQIAGPTETLIIADESANPRLVAADLLAQAEHDEQATAILLTTSSALAGAVEREIDDQLEYLARASIAASALTANGLIGVVDTIGETVALANEYAPEHLCLLVADPWALVPLVRHAGGIFLGECSAEALGDYAAGPSHIMPTGGTARYSSPVNVRDFQKVISIIAANDTAIDQIGETAAILAEAEGLGGHAAAIRARRRPRTG